MLGQVSDCLGLSMQVPPELNAGLLMWAYAQLPHRSCSKAK